VPSAYLAVQDHGQRLSYALDGFELQRDAENKERFWSWTAGLALDLTSELARTPLAFAADLVDGYAPQLLGMDGTFDQGVDRGPRFGPADAAGDVLATLPPDRAAQVRVVQQQAETSFRRVAELLGSPEAPQSPPAAGLMGPLVDIATDGLGDVATDRLLDPDRPRGDVLPGRR
jgi:hypothetical protein